MRNLEEELNQEKIKSKPVKQNIVKDINPQPHNCFLFHPWSKWEDQEIISVTVGGKQTGRILVQMKHCKHCGMKKYRQEFMFNLLEKEKGRYKYQ